jgi:hypothetical protein
MVTKHVLEEGKVNVLLRMIVDFAAYQCVGDDYARVVNEDAAGAETLTRHFEHDMSVILACCLRSVETVQTIDIPLLFEYVAHCLSHPHQLNRLGSLVSGQQEEVLSTWALQLLAETLANGWGLPGESETISVPASPHGSLRFEHGREELSSMLRDCMIKYSLLATVLYVIEKDFHSNRNSISHRSLHAAATIFSATLAHESYRSRQYEFWNLTAANPSPTTSSTPLNSAQLKKLLMDRHQSLQICLLDRLAPLDAAHKRRYRPILDAVLLAQLSNK